MTDSLIHLRVPAAIKGRWIRASRAAGMRLTDWIAQAVEAHMPQDHMTPQQYDALAELLRLQDSPSREAVRLVLVDGLKPAEAARQAGVSPQAVSNALRRCRNGMALAQVVA